jgi:hypothetical protein
MTPATQFRTNDASTSPALERRGIPFDYAFRFSLSGKTGNVINSIVTVSIEATFTAVSIGYGVIPDVSTIVFGPKLSPPDPGPGEIFFFAPETGPSGPRTLGNLFLGEILDGLDPAVLAGSPTLRNESGVEAILKNGFKLNPEVAEFVLANATNELKTDVIPRLFQVVGSPSDLIQFKYAIFDEGSGREFQSEPILNIAGLGSAGGERPFRHFAQPIVFRPRSTIRMEVTEVSDFKGELHVSLHGYKVLGDSNSPTGVNQNRLGPSRRR